MLERDFKKFLDLTGGWLSDDEKQKAKSVWPERSAEIDAIPRSRLEGMMRTMESRQTKPEFRGVQVQTSYPEKAPKLGFFDQLQQKVAQHQQMYADKSVPEKVLGGLIRLPATMTLANKQLITEPQKAVPEFGKMLYGSGKDIATLIRAGAEAISPGDNMGGVDPYTKKEVERIASELEQLPVEKTMELTSLPAIAIPALRAGMKKFGTAEILESKPMGTNVPSEGQIKGLQENVAYASQEGLLDRNKPVMESEIPSIRKNVNKKIQENLGKKEQAQKISQIEKAYEQQPAKPEYPSMFESEYRLDQNYLNDAKWQEKYGDWPRNTKTPPPITGDVYASFLGLNPETFRQLGITIKQGTRMGAHAARTLTNIVGPIFKASRNQVKLPESRTIISQVESSWRKAGRMAGEWYDDYLESGINKLDDRQLAQLHNDLQYNPPPKPRGADLALDVLEEIKWREKYGAKAQDIAVRNVVNGLNKIFTSVADKAKALNVMVRNPDGTLRPFEPIGGYVPRVIKRDIVEIMSKDINSILEQAKTLDDAQFEKFVSNAIDRQTGLRPETIEALKHIVEERGAINMRDAVMYAFRRLYDEQFVPMGNLERGRLLDFPASFYETDPRIYMPKYIRGAAKRLAEIEMWGQEPDLIMSKIADISVKNMDDAKTIQKILETYTGANEIKNALSPMAKSGWNAFTAWEVLTKIGTGTATIPNISQLSISSIPDMGFLRFAKGVGEALTKAGWKRVRRSGAIVDNPMGMLSGQQSLSGKLGWLAEFSLKASLFDAVNRFNKAITASMSNVAVRDWYKAAQKDNIYGRWARKKIADVGIDYKAPLTEEKILEAMYYKSQNLQLAKNVLEEPLYFNNPRTRPFTLFWRFGYRQARLTKDMIVEEIKGGNPMPFLRLIAGGYIGGEFVNWAKDEIKNLLSHKKQPDIEENWWQHAINNLAAGGTFGVISDIFGRVGESDNLLDGDAVEKAMNSAAFRLTPIPINEVNAWTNGMYAMVKYYESQNKYTGNAIEAIKRTAKAAPFPLAKAVGSPLLRMAAQPLKTPRMKDAQLQNEYSDMRQRILTRYLRDDNSGAKQLKDAWNKIHPEKQIKITNGDVWDERDRRKKQAKKW